MSGSLRSRALLAVVLLFVVDSGRRSVGSGELDGVGRTKWGIAATYGVVWSLYRHVGVPARRLLVGFWPLTRMTAV